MLNEENNTCKVVLFGEPGVGKTCIIGRFVNDDFDENTISTCGASYAGRSKEFEEYDKKVNFDLWDTSGQERYRCLSRIFYRNAAAAILVYDITRRESYEEVKQYWYNQVVQYAPKNISNNR